MKSILATLILFACAASASATDCVGAFCGGQQVVVQQNVGHYGVQQFAVPVHQRQFVQRQFVRQPVFVQRKFVRQRAVVVRQPVFVQQRAFVGRRAVVVSPFVARPFFGFGFGF